LDGAEGEDVDASPKPSLGGGGCPLKNGSETDGAILVPSPCAFLSLRVTGREKGVDTALSIPSVSSDLACKQFDGELRVVSKPMWPLEDDLDDFTCPLGLEEGKPAKSAPFFHDSDALGGVRAIRPNEEDDDALLVAFASTISGVDGFCLQRPVAASANGEGELFQV